MMHDTLAVRLASVYIYIFFRWPFFRASVLAQVILYDALDLKVLNKVMACRSRVVAVSFSQDGKLLATASEQGTVIRIFTVPAAVKVRSCVCWY